MAAHLDFNPPAPGVVWLLQYNGYVVTCSREGQMYHACARHAKTGERHAVSGTDPTWAICELADRCGMELEDG